jgi:two-component system osmolarity sensor histidine kinase EnvZ
MAANTTFHARAKHLGSTFRRLLPRTLLWQTFLLATLLLVLTFGVWGQIFSYFAEPARARDAARMVVSVVNLTRTALINADTTRRNDLLIDLVSLEGIRIYPAEPEDNILPLPDTRATRLLTAAVQRSLGEDTLFASRWKTLDGFWINFHITPGDEEKYWVMLPLDRVTRQDTFVWLFWGCAFLLVAIAGGYLIASSVGTPLQRLAQAANMVGSGKTPVLLDEDGPQEIAVVARAFNQMTADLARSAADRALILAGVSHDLRTPLARLRLEIEMSAITGTDTAAMVADIEVMNRIIGQFLDYARGAVQEPMQPHDLAALIADVVSPYRLRGMPIKIVAPQRLTVLAHGLSLRRAFANLIDNALRYADQDPRIDIHVFDKDGMACAEVADRGPGIPESELERLRQPFTRMDAARSNTRGAGLGLAIVDRIIQAHNGRLELRPRDGGGLRAIVHLPAYQMV